MRYRDGRRSVCVSSQSGCTLTCTFCATGRMKFGRNLTASEILDQVLHFRRIEAVDHLVFMGMGEPLMNPKAVFPTLDILNKGYRFGARRITISTVGVVPGILRMAELPEQYRLAVSLHAPNHELRQRLIPLEKKYPLPELLDALRRFDEAGGKRITFEYVMIDGVTDLPEVADELASVVKEITAFVNLIPFNPIPGTDWKPSKRARLDYFVERLKRHGVTAYVRESRGRDIAAACGQLRAEVTQGRTPVQMGSV
jgi:23S rRNA (adenine2503-C2)-methyltransferase